jgi:3-hydroxy acid dehydrogenase/malonic semialdehyde reductase
MDTRPIAFVTGASAGFGQAIVRRFVREGLPVVAAGRRMDRLQALAEELGPAVLPLQLDVRDRSAVESAVATLPPAFADIAIVVNNAGLALGLEPAHKAVLDDWQTMVETNINGLLYVTRALLPGMVARDRGHVVNMGSVAGEWPYPGGNVYGGTKAFVRQFSLNLRADLAATHVRVTDVEPGLCGGTEFSSVRFHGDQDRAAAIYQGTEPLSAEDIADTVWWIVSRPPHININTISLMPVCQSFGPLRISRMPE